MEVMEPLTVGSFCYIVIKWSFWLTSDMMSWTLWNYSEYLFF